MEIGKQAFNLSAKSLTRVSRNVNILRNLNLDPAQFNTRFNAAGVFISLRQGALSEEEEGRWTIEKISNTSASIDTGIVNVMGEENAWAKANVTGLASGVNIIYGISQRDGGGSVTMDSNPNVMVNAASIGNENFAFPIGEINTTSGVITQYISSDFNVQYPKEHMALYQVPVVREYDESGNMVAIGSETDPLPSGHYYEQTFDWTRAHG